MKNKNIILMLGLFISFLDAENICEKVDDYTLKDKAKGVTLCVDGTDSVQIIDLAKGAKLKFLYHQVKPNENKFEMQTMATYWKSFRRTNQKTAFSVVNGSLFNKFGDKSYNKSKIAELAYVFKDYDKGLTRGNKYNPKNKKYRAILTITGSKATINTSYSEPKLDDDKTYEKNKYASLFEAFQDSSLKNHTYVLGGLSTLANKHNGWWWKDRTMIGVSKDGTKIYILVNEGMKVNSAKEVLSSFGANKIMMLDGGGSSQLRSSNYNILGADSGKGGRKIPQAIGIVSGVQYTDIDTLSQEKQEAINYLSTIMPLFNGNNGKFDVGKPIKRTELLKIIVKLKENIMKQKMERATLGEEGKLKKTIEYKGKKYTYYMEIDGKKYLDLKGIDPWTNKLVPSWFTNNYVRKVIKESIAQGDEIKKSDKGTGMYIFTPTRDITYWELHKIIVKTFTGGIPISNKWYNDYYNCLDKDYVNRFGKTIKIHNGNTKNTPVNREDVALILYRALILWEDGKFDESSCQK